MSNPVRPDLTTDRLIILCGGLGSRLKAVVKDCPKILADIHGKAFLDYLLQYFQGYGITEVILSTGIGAAQVAAYISKSHKSYEFNIKCYPEETPLGTGGAIAHIFRNHDTKPSYIINGDSLWDMPFSVFKDNITQPKGLTLLALPITEEARYGQFSLSADGMISGFLAHDQEKSDPFAKNKVISQNWINGGMYYASQDFAEEISAMEGKFSLESKIFPYLEAEKKLFAVASSATHIDIGTIESYAEAQKMNLFRKTNS